MITVPTTRRRFLAISAAAAIAGGARASAGEAMRRWRGTALGADATLTLAGVDEAAARAHVAAVRAEIDRLEGLFSLYRRGSAIRRLNGAGRLDAPAPDFVRLLRLAGRVHDRTGGAFDPSVQPFWQLHAAGAADPAGLADAAARVGWRHLRISAERIEFRRAGMAITLNGIAQGHVADRVAALLRQRGLRDVLVDAGEIVALGGRPGGAGWGVEVAAPDGRPVRALRLTDRALATSAPRGTVLDPAGRVGHILDPYSGRPAGRWGLVSVSAATAALADALSTAFCLMTRRDIDRALAHFSDAALEVALPA